MRPKVLAIDLDGTLLEWRKFPEYGPPVVGISDELAALKRAGWVISVWTCRDKKEYQRIREHLYQHGIDVDYINMNPHEPPSTSPKIYADVYLDDRGLSFDGETQGLAAKILKHRPWYKQSLRSVS